MAKPPRDQHTAEVAARLRVGISATFPSLKAWCDAYGYSPGALNMALTAQNYPDLVPLIEWCDDKGMTLDFIFRGVKAGVADGVAARLKQPKQASQAVSVATGRQRREKNMA